MMNKEKIINLLILILVSIPYLVSATENDNKSSFKLNSILITAPAMGEPFKVKIDPKTSQQPLPANDGASFLKNIPGFSMIRKGGTYGDPVLRGMVGSRLNILLDGMEFHGGCGNRMDPPTAYVFPKNYDQVTIIKGPQTVLYGNGNSAGVILFEHDRDNFKKTEGMINLLGGSWGRIDGIGTARAVFDLFSLSATLSHAQSDNYEDGNGRKINSKYQRQSATFLASYKPTLNTRIDIDAIISNGEAAYADRVLDGSKFDRNSYGLAIEKKAISKVLRKISARLYYSYIDHVMDNYSLRTVIDSDNDGSTEDQRIDRNPDRKTHGFRLLSELKITAILEGKFGFDWKKDQHTARRSAVMGNNFISSQSSVRNRDYESEIYGLFTEITANISDYQRIVSGFRYDHWQGDRYMRNALLNTVSEPLYSGFLRYESDSLMPSSIFYIGLGYNERPMDYWESVNRNGLTATFHLETEKTTQLDAGIIWKQNDLNGSLSVFYANVNDYILATTNTVFNVDATRYGFEADLNWYILPNLKGLVSLAYVHANNESMNTALAQTPPLEGKLGLTYTNKKWNYGGVLRLVSSQNRVHVGFGNIVGTDLGDTGGFVTLGLNASYKALNNFAIDFGIDNLFDKTYAEHISRTGEVLISGFDRNFRVNEPGRTFWASMQFVF